MESKRIGRCLPLMALLAAGLMVVGCSGGGGTGGDGGTGGSGGGGGGGSGGDIPFPHCGDGVVQDDEREECDDANSIPTDCCNNCLIVNPTCGNSVIECGEDCDDGNTVPGDTCSEICKTPGCGNGYVESPEACDDGNLVSGDGCSATCEPECLRDQDCDEDAMEICVRANAEDQYGSCTPTGVACQADGNCGSTARERCGTEGCYCKENANDDGNYGVCWLRVKGCESCETDADCGNSVVYDRPAECKPFHMAGGDNNNVCLPKNLPSRTCPPGYVAGGEDEGGLDMRGYCVPQTGFCPIDPCHEDADCRDPAYPVCDQARQICIKGCYINWTQDRETVGCSPSKPACHAMPERLDPNLLNDCATAPTYGFGKCGIECETDVDCAHRGNDVNGNPYVCKNDGGVNRCRPAGCVDDMECPEPGNGSEYLGYCDPYRQACTWNNCRMGVDPRQGCGVNDPYLDCATTHKCVEDTSGGQPEGYGVCVLKNCIDNGGAMLDCKAGQFCAGEPMISRMTAEEEGEPLPVPDDVPIGVCYDMDIPVWCTTACAANADCRGDNLPGRHDESPGYCMSDPAGNPMCWFGCNYNAECPGQWMCSSEQLRVSTLLPPNGAGGLKICESDLDCGTGNHCVEPKVYGDTFTAWSTYFDPDTNTEYRQQPFKVCSCTESGTCGGGAVCNSGIGSRNPLTPDVQVDRYCTTGSDDFCGPDGTLEWYGDVTMDNAFNFYPVFYCGCGPGTTATCPAIGPAGTGVIEGEAIRCGDSLVDRNICVGGSICAPYFPWDDQGNQTCGVR